MMRDAEIAVEFRPSGKTVYVLQGTRLAEAAAIAGLVLDAPCGGEGTCGKCRVRVCEGTCPATTADAGASAPRSWPQATVWLARRRFPNRSPWKCRSAPCRPRITRSLLETEDLGAEILDPAICKQYVELPPPSRDDDVPDLKRLERAVGRSMSTWNSRASCRPGCGRTSFAAQRCWPTMFRRMSAGCWTSSPAIRDSSVAVAVDVGTTTLAATLLNLTTGQAVEVATRLNPQTQFGDDVLSRILHCRQPDGAGPASAGDRCRHRWADRTTGRAGGDTAPEIYEIACSGNTTMQQLLCGNRSAEPRGSAICAGGRPGPDVRAAELGLDPSPRPGLMLPVIGGFVGGDTVSGVLATGLDVAAGPSLLVDIGTNGEIVLSAGGRLHGGLDGCRSGIRRSAGSPRACAAARGPSKR